MKRLTTGLLLLICIWAGLPVAAQEYTGDVTLVSGNERIVTLRAAGIAEKKKDARLHAVKSALHALLKTGVEGVNGGKPLMQRDDESFERNFFESRYLGYAQNIVEEKGSEKLLNKSVRMYVTLDVALVRLRKDLEMDGMTKIDPTQVSMGETEAAIGLPTIMVVPYRKEGETFKSILENDFDRRIAVSKVQEGFVKEQVSTIDFEACLEAARRAGHYTDNLSTSNDAALMKSSGADVYVTLDIKKDVTAQGSSVTLIMKAYRTATGEVLATKQGGNVRRYAGVGTDVLCSYATADCLPSFLKDISTSFATGIEGGSSIVLNIGVADGSATLITSSATASGAPLSTAIRNWVRKHTQNGRYHVKGVVDESMIFDVVKIPAKDVDGLPMDAYTWGDNLVTYLAEEGVTATLRVEGNTLYVTLQ